MGWSVSYDHLFSVSRPWSVAPAWGPWGYLNPEPTLGRWKQLRCLYFCTSLRHIPGEAANPASGGWKGGQGSPGTDKCQLLTVDALLLNENMEFWSHFRLGLKDGTKKDLTNRVLSDRRTSPLLLGWIPCFSCSCSSLCLLWVWELLWVCPHLFWPSSLLTLSFRNWVRGNWYFL